MTEDRDEERGANDGEEGGGTIYLLTYATESIVYSFRFRNMAWDDIIVDLEVRQRH